MTPNGVGRAVLEVLIYKYLTLTGSGDDKWIQDF